MYEVEGALRAASATCKYPELLARKRRTPHTAIAVRNDQLPVLGIRQVIAVWIPFPPETNERRSACLHRIWFVTDVEITGNFGHATTIKCAAQVRMRL